MLSTSMPISESFLHLVNLIAAIAAADCLKAQVMAGALFTGSSTRSAV